MFDKVFKKLHAEASNDVVENHRKHPRRENDRCAMLFGNTLIPVRDWSMGGALLDTDERLFSEGQNMDFTLKFQTGNALRDLHHQGQVVRRANGRIALQFSPLSTDKEREFMNVMEHCIADEFARSQATA